MDYTINKNFSFFYHPFRDLSLSRLKPFQNKRFWFSPTSSRLPHLLTVQAGSPRHTHLLCESWQQTSAGAPGTFTGGNGSRTCKCCLLMAICILLLLSLFFPPGKQLNLHGQMQELCLGGLSLTGTRSFSNVTMLGFNCLVRKKLKCFLGKKKIICFSSGFLSEWNASLFSFLFRCFLQLYFLLNEIWKKTLKAGAF